jgi:hypothetical protein
MNAELESKVMNDPKLRRAISRKNLYWFYRLYFPHYVTYKIADFQKEMIYLLQDEKIRQLVITAFRGSAKSTICSLIYPLWCVVGERQKKYVLLVCQTQQLASQMLANIKAEIDCPCLMTKDFDFGFEQIKSEWNADTIVLPGYDVLATHEMLGGKYAVVCPTSESVAKRDVANQWNYINSFKKIFICFDNDEAGYKAASDIAPLFDFHKVYHVRLTTHKDPNEYLEAQQVDSFRKIFENAKRFSPDNIISSFSDIREALRKDSESQIGTYPFSSLQTNTYGLHEGEVVVVKARRGVGKTELLRAIEHHLLKTTKANLGLIHLEEDTGTTIKAIAGYELSVPATLPDCGLSEDDILQGYKQAVSDDEGRVHLYLSFDREDEELLFNNIRFLVAAHQRSVRNMKHFGEENSSGCVVRESNLDRIADANLQRVLLFVHGSGLRGCLYS